MSLMKYVVVIRKFALEPEKSKGYADHEFTFHGQQYSFLLDINDYTHYVSTDLQ